jgi:transcriptional antiterminator
VFAAQYDISTRTLQRYFETTTGISSKKVLQIIAYPQGGIAHGIIADFHYSIYGYYDHSHFFKHLRKFLSRGTLSHLKPHLRLLAGIRE